MSDVTRILSAIEAGDPRAADQAPVFRGPEHPAGGRGVGRQRERDLRPRAAHPARGPYM